MNELKKLFFSLKKTDIKDGYMVMCCFENSENDFIFYARDEDELYNRLEGFNKISKIIEIYISRSISSCSFKKIYKRFACYIYVDGKKLDNLMGENSFFEMYINTAKKILEVERICREEKEFNAFYQMILRKSNSYIKTINALLKDSILKYEENYNIFLSMIGQMLFSKEMDIAREIEIINKEVNNNVVYSKNIMLSGELSALRRNAVQYIYEILPNLQSRNGLVSKVSKPIDMQLLQSIMDYILSINQYEKDTPIRIEINPIEIKFSFLETKKMILSKIFTKYFTSMPWEQLKDELEANNYCVSKSNKRNQTIISLLFIDNVDRYDSSLDQIDYMIIDIANRREYFTRALLDDELEISKRNINNHLNKLIMKNIIGMEGTGKAIKYFKK